MSLEACVSAVCPAGVNALVTTEDRETYNNIWLNVDQQSHIVFSVMVRSDNFSKFVAKITQLAPQVYNF